MKQDPLLSVSALGALMLAMLATAASGQVLEVLHSFTGPDGAGPQAGLVQGWDGCFYGTTVNGGTGRGTVFRLSAPHVLNTMVSFNYTNGSRPFAELTATEDGALYGLTADGGRTDLNYGSGYGTIFKLTTNGIATTVIAFDGTNGAHPVWPLVQSKDGNFYGTTQLGNGTLFSMSPGGTLTNLPAFAGTDGYDPSGPLVEGTEGTLYGTTAWGGPSNPNGPYGSGTVFRVTTNGAYAMLAAFDGITASPFGGLVLGDDGNFYGTTWDPQPGTIFKMSPDGTLSTLHWFSGSDGDGPQGGLMQAWDHLLYGTTEFGGTYGNGNVFRISTNGLFENVISFNGANGSSPVSRLIQGADGNLYGTTEFGGTSNMGTVFRMVFPTLSATRLGNEFVVSWSTNQIGFILQSSGNLIPPNWIDCTNTPAVSGGQFFVSNSMSGGAQFFRLKK